MPGYIERACVLAESDTDCAGRRCPRWHFITECIVIFGLLVPTAHAQTRTTFDIDAGPAAQSLNLYAQQARVQLGFSADVVGGIRTNPVKGAYETAEALELLLSGTGLEAEHGEKGITIHHAATETKSGQEIPTSESARLQFNQAMAQAASERSTTPAKGFSTDRSEKAAGKLEEIVVTGTQIRGAAPAGSSIITLDRDYIEMSSLATTQDILQSLPQNVGLGANENTSTVGIAPGSFNYGDASSVNLRGLGTASTLVLINGRRSASGGGRGDFVDLNSIPASAIERVEVLPDGASAIYGSDAIGGVINVVLRSNYDGAKTTFRYAPDTDGIEELQVGQIFGKSWNSGNALLIYDFHDRSALRAADREYTRDSNLTRLGGSNHSSPASNPGNINRYTLSDGTVETVQLAVPTGQDGRNLTPSDLITGSEDENLQNIREGSTVLPDQRRNSLFVTVSQDLSDNTQLFAESKFSTRDVEARPQQLVTNNLTVPNTNPFFVDPFGGSTDLRINYSFSDDFGAQRTTATVDTYGLTLGVTAGIVNNWELESYASHSIEDTFSFSYNFPNSALLRDALADTDPAAAFNPFGDGSHTNPATLEAIKGFRRFDIESRLTVFSLRADGALFEMPGGVAKAAIGVQVRDEALGSDELGFSSTLEPVTSTANFDLDRDITAAFSEIFLPIVTDRNSHPGIKELVFSIAGRYENYSDFGSSFNPKLGVSWSPVQGIVVRSTIGTSFRAPLLVELDDTQRAYQVLNVPDPASPTGTTSTLYLFGNNPALQAQEGTTWTAGFDIEPAALPGLEVSFTYFETDVDKLISLPGDLITLPFLQPDVYSQIIDRDPAEARLVALLSDPRCFCGSATSADVEAIIDFRRQNLAKAKLSGVDANVAYAFATEVGSFRLALFGSHLFEFKEQLVNGPEQDNVDTIAKPNSLQLRGSLSWAAGGFNATVIGDHIGPYRDDRSDPERAISSWTTWDLQLRYDFGQHVSRLLEDTSVAVSVRNLFDRDPPFVDLSNGVGFDAINANAIQRLVTVQFIKNW